MAEHSHGHGPPVDNDILAYAVWHAQVTPRKLPGKIYRYNANKLLTGLFKGYSKHPVEISILSPEHKKLQFLKENIFKFSAAKTFQQVKDMWDAREKMSAALTQGDYTTPFREFKQKVAEISDQYNVNWLETEYKTAISGGRNASMWHRIQEQRHTFPNLTYHTDGQDTVCDICAPLDGITLPINDSFWDEFYPDNHYNCNCYVTQEDEDVTLSDEDEVDEAAEQAGDNMDDMWKRNVGKNEFFTKGHPYFNVPREFKDFEKDNFGLPLPE